MKALGIDLGGTKIHFGVIDAQGNIIDAYKKKTPIQIGGQGILDLIIHEAKAILKSHGDMPVGLGTPGLVSYPEGRILGCTPNLPEWNNLQLKKRLKNALNVPIHIDNDANTATWGEFKAGRGQGLEHFVLLTLGTGLGSGIIFNKQLKRGFSGFGIGFGHMIIQPQGRFCNCGQQGCLEAYVSGNGLQKTFQLKGGDLTQKGPDIFKLASQGDSRAKDSIQEMLFSLSLGLSNILNTIAPQKVFIGGGLAEQGEKQIIHPLISNIKAIMSMPFQETNIIQLAQLSSNAGLIGAALLAMDEEDNGANN